MPIFIWKKQSIRITRRSEKTPFLFLFGTNSLVALNQASPILSQLCSNFFSFLIYKKIVITSQDILRIHWLCSVPQYSLNTMVEYFSGVHLLLQHPPKGIHFVWSEAVMQKEVW